MRNVLILFCFIAFSAAAYAEEPATQIITNQEKGTITFMIDGKVVESINYGGTITDSGSAHVEKMIEAGGKDEE